MWSVGHGCTDICVGRLVFGLQMCASFRLAHSISRIIECVDSVSHIIKSVNYVSFMMKAGLGVSRTNADSQWNTVYKAFYRIRLWKRSDQSVVIQT